MAYTFCKYLFSGPQVPAYNSIIAQGTSLVLSGVSELRAIPDGGFVDQAHYILPLRDGSAVIRNVFSR